MFRARLRFRVYDTQGKLRKTLYTHNSLTQEAADQLFRRAFEDGSPDALSPWYMSLINADTYSAIDYTDTEDNHPGWDEETNYGNGEGDDDRKLVSVNRLSLPNVGAYCSAQFLASSNISVQGIFLTNGPFKGGTTDFLYSTATIPTPIDLAVGETLDVGYSWLGVRV